MKRKLKAIWLIVVSSGFYVTTRDRKGGLYRLTKSLQIRDAGAIIEDLTSLVEAEQSVADARSILDATN